MKDIRYVVRFFKENKYLYSIHCAADILDDIVSNAKDSDMTVKIVAYESDSDNVEV